MLLVGVAQDDPEGVEEAIRGEDLGPRAQGDDPPREQEHLVVLDRLGDVVGRGDDGRAAGELRGEGPQVELAPARVEAGCWLVKDDEVGPPGKPGPGRPAAAGRRTGCAGACARWWRRPSTRGPRRPGRDPRRASGRRGPARVAGHPDHVDRPQRQHEARRVELALVGERRRPACPGSQHLELAADRRQEPDERAEQGRLARPVGADQGERGPWTDDEVDRLDDGPAVVADRQALGLDVGGVAAGPLTPWPRRGPGSGPARSPTPGRRRR